MKAIGEILKEKTIQLDTLDPVLQEGFTQLPNFIMKYSKLSMGAIVTYAKFLSYAWHNDSCFPGQDRLAEELNMSRPRVCQFIGELEKAGFITIQRRGQGKTNVYTVHFQVKKRGKRMVNIQMLAGQHLEVDRPTTRSKPANFSL